MSFLSAIAKVPKAIFGFLASSKGQALIQTGEGVAVAIDPALAGIITLANSWIGRALTVEALATAAGQQQGTGTQKAAAVMNAITPQVLQYFPNARQDQIAKANDAIVAFLNAFDAPATPGQPASQPSPTPQPAK